MSKLGTCSMVIEPHTFEITLYTVREPRMTYPPPVDQQPFSTNQSSAPQAKVSGAFASNGPFWGQQPLASSQPKLPTFREGFAHFDAHGPPPPIHHPFPPTGSSPSTPGPNNTASSNAANQSNTLKTKPKTSPDPVIQMLATRAASDHSLKALMKIVASGRATQTELREFQSHIDELNTEINAGRGPPQSQDRVGPNHTPSVETSTSSNSTQNPGPAMHSKTGHSSTFPPTAPPYQNETPTYSQYAPSAKSKTTHPYKSDVSAIVFDFGGKGDRFSFPRFSILEYLPGGTQVIVSFLIIRTGGEASSGNYKDHLTYYQPVTLRLSSPQPRILEPLARVVAPADEVRRYMNDVFDKMKPAETAYLATRLPKTKDIDAMDLDKPTTNTEKVVIKPLYSPPSFIVPMAA